MVGIIDAGGGMRGIYTAGVYDYCLKNNIEFDLCVGVSAGSANQVSFIAKQYERNYRSYTHYSFRKEYMGWGNFLRAGSFVNLDYIYSTLSNSDGEDPLDYPAFTAAKTDYIVVATDAETGLPAYFPKHSITLNHYDAIKCSCAVPVFNKPYPFQGKYYLDGGISDPIPLLKAFETGCEKVIVLITRPRDYYRSPKNDRRLALFLQKKYPKAAECLKNRSKYY
ncbi:MAG: patatin family protein, partial [Lachnospiraceae bacterium]|nr:patatin family protein [Lachnospiraceae bacterium]